MLNLINGKLRSARRFNQVIDNPSHKIQSVSHYSATIANGSNLINRDRASFSKTAKDLTGKFIFDFPLNCMRLLTLSWNLTTAENACNGNIKLRYEAQQDLPTHSLPTSALFRTSWLCTPDPRNNAAASDCLSTHASFRCFMFQLTLTLCN